MSIVMTSVYLYNEGIYSLYKKLSDIVPEVKAWSDDAITKFLMEFAVRKFDYHQFELEDFKNKIPLMEAQSFLLDSQKRVVSTRERNPLVDFSVEVWIYPLSKSRTMIKIASDHADQVDPMFEKHLKLTEYSYWNNSDPPDGIPYKKWKKREKVWDKFPMGTNLSYVVTNIINLPIFSRNKIMNFIPDVNKRASGIASELAFRAIKKNNSDKEPFSILFSDEFCKERDNLKKIVKSKLVENITYDMLYEKIK